MAKTKKVIVAGTLIIPGTDEAYFLMDAEPTLKPIGMPDDTVLFFVVNSGLPAHHVVVRGPFVVDYSSAGKEIEITQEEVTQTNIFTEPKWLEEVLKGEPASIAEN